MFLCFAALHGPKPCNLLHIPYVKSRIFRNFLNCLFSPFQQPERRFPLILANTLINTLINTLNNTLINTLI